MSKPRTHILRSIPLTPSGPAGPLVRSYCLRLVPEGRAVSPDSGRATCQPCLETQAQANAWREAFRAELAAPARAGMSEPVRRREAWEATRARLGNDPLGLPAPPAPAPTGKPARSINRLKETTS